MSYTLSVLMHVAIVLLALRAINYKDNIVFWLLMSVILVYLMYLNKKGEENDV